MCFDLRDKLKQFYFSHHMEHMKASATLMSVIVCKHGNNKYGV